MLVVRTWHHDEELKRSEARFRQLLDLAPDAILGVDRAGIILFANELCEATFGYPRAEMVGQSIEMLIPERYRADHVRYRAAYVASPSMRPMGVGRDLAARRKDGTQFPATVTLSTIERDDELIVLAAVHDITDRARAERERSDLEYRLRQAERLESVGQLAGGVAHDFNNLLAVILNYASFVAEKVDDPDLRADLEQIQAAARRGAELTHQLLLFSRLEPSLPESLDVGAVLADLMRMLERTIGEHVALDVMLAPDTPPVLADRAKFDQVLVNLIVNARDAMPDGGRITIESRTVAVDDPLEWPDLTLAVGTYVRVTVTDTGVGMERDVMARAFEPFFTTKARGRGTGLGLATVYGIVNEAGGRVKLYSEPGAGTTVSIYLPAADRRALVREDTAPPRSVAAGGVVLLVEDDPAVREISRRILARGGYEVMAVASPTEALDTVHGIDQPSIVVSDVVMPAMSGPDLLARLREHWPRLPGLLISGYPEQSSRSAGEVSDALLHKPFTEKELLNRVHEILAVP